MGLIRLEQYHRDVATGQDWVIPSVLPAQAHVLLLGAPKAGKTTLAMQLACAIGQGAPWLRCPTTHGPVLYLQLDMSPVVWATMLHAHAQAGVTYAGEVWTPAPADLPLPFDLMQTSCQARLAQWLADCAPAFVVVDAWRECHGADENSATAVQAVYAVCRRVFQGCTVLYVHHARKGMGDRHWTQAQRGSSYLAGACDACWWLRPERREATLQMVSRYAPPQQWTLHRTAQGMWTRAESAAQEARLQMRAYVMGLQGMSSGMSRNQLYQRERATLEAHGVSRSTFYRWLQDGARTVATRGGTTHRRDDDPDLSPSPVH